MKKKNDWKLWHSDKKLEAREKPEKEQMGVEKKLP